MSLVSIPESSSIRPRLPTRSKLLLRSTNSSLRSDASRPETWLLRPEMSDGFFSRTA